MATRTATAEADPIIESRDDLLAVFQKGEKPKEDWRIGTEHEKFVFWKDTKRAPSYEEPGGIHALMIGLTLAPAGQFELSGAPLDNLHETCAETDRHLRQCKEIGDKLGIGFLGLG